MLLRQPRMDFDEIEHPRDLVTDWPDVLDVPRDWRVMVDSCMSEDPNMRPRISSLTEFWVAAANFQTSSKDLARGSQ